MAHDTSPMGNWTVNVQGNCVALAQGMGYHAYYANGVTAIEVGHCTKKQAYQRAAIFGRVLYIFE